MGKCIDCGATIRGKRRKYCPVCRVLTRTKKVRTRKGIEKIAKCFFPMIR